MYVVVIVVVMVVVVVVEEEKGFGWRWLRTEESDGRRGGRDEPFLG